MLKCECIKFIYYYLLKLNLIEKNFILQKTVYKQNSYLKLILDEEEYIYNYTYTYNTYEGEIKFIYCLHSATKRVVKQYKIK